MNLLTPINLVNTSITAPRGIVTGLAYGQISALQIWGDSMAAGDGVVGEAGRWPFTLPTAMSRLAFRGGVGGETSIQVAARCLADNVHRNGVYLIWMGHNNLAPPSTVVSDMNAMLAWMTTWNHHYLVLSPVQNSNYAVGGTQYNDTLALQSALLTAAGANYIDVNAPLAAAYNPLDPQDVYDVANGYTPSTLRADQIHLNAAGQAVITATLQPAIISAGY